MSDHYTLADVIGRDSKFSTFTKAINDAGLYDKLREVGPFTIFAPTNTAFAKLPAETMTDLLKPENKAKFVGILSYHIIEGKVTAAELSKLKSAKSLQGQPINFETTDGIKINGARLQARNVDATNGLIHSIDTVLTPATTAKVA